MRFSLAQPFIARIVIAVAALFVFQTARAQVAVTGSIGADGTYSTLNAAFTAVNAAGPHTGATIVMTLTASTNEGTNTALLNAGAWTTFTIRPAVGVAATVTGATTAGNSLIQLNGADNVTIDGLNTGGSSLTISNTTASNLSGTSTLWFVGGATNNVVTNCTILGAFSGVTINDGGTICFGTDAITPNGNDNNTISNNNIGPVGPNLPSKAIYSLGSSATTALYNSGNLISGNTIYDFFSAGGASAGIYLSNNNAQWTIQNNKLYQTATRTQTLGSTHAGIEVLNTNNQGCMVSGNTIGYSSAAGTGVYSIVGVGGTRFTPIHFVAGTVSMTTIQNNTITALSVSGNLAGSAGAAPFIGISVSGLVTVSGNTIGSATVPGAITVSSSNPSTTSETYGIFQASGTSPLITNNSIGGIDLSNTANGPTIFYGIRPIPSGAFLSTVQNNIIGFSTAPVTCSSTSLNSRMVGIYVTSGGVNMTGNTVAYLSNNCAFPVSGFPSGLMGIQYDNAGVAPATTISQNHVHSLTNTNAAAATSVVGIGYNGSSSVMTAISTNSVHSLSAAYVSSNLRGIFVNAGQTTVSNNMVSLGLDASGASITVGTRIIGILEQGTNKIYFNSVYIGGSGITGTADSYAFFNGSAAGSHDIRNNIFYNARSNSSGTGKHYAMLLVGTIPNQAGYTTDYNDLFVSGTGGILGVYNFTDQLTMAAWRTASGQDLNSVNGNPSFINPVGNNTTVDLHISTGFPPVEATGTPIATITTDYDGQTRAGLTPTDIGADAGDFLLLPVLGTYPNTTVMAGRNTTVTPTTAPSNLLSATAYSTAKLDGILTVNPTTGIVSITDAMPAGTYTVTVKGVGAAGPMSTSFTLTVTNPACSQGLFYGTGTVPLATWPINMALGDFNNDGKQDIAVPSYNTNAVSIRLGDGLGGFSGTTQIPVDASPISLAVADFNGDGKQDLAVPASGAYAVSIRLGNGLGGFTGTTAVSVGWSPTAIAVGDFNNDGKFDIATVNMADGTVSINLGDGLGGFGAQSVLVTGTTPRSLQVGDFNEDGNQDIAVSCQGPNYVSIFLGNGAGAFGVQTTVSVSATPTCIVLGDFNNDNHQDFVTSSSGFFAASVRYGDGAGGFSGTTEIFISSNNTSGDLAVGDFNGDGNSDFVITRFNTAELAIQYGNGAGAFSGNTPFTTGGYAPHLPAVGDFNGDGIQDIAVVNEVGANVAIRLGGAADINLVGNAVNIPDGSTTPALADGTDFGSVEICGNSTLTHTFTFQNTGTTYLALSGVSITGANAADFIAYPSSFGLNAGGTQNISVVFDPSAAGPRTATLHFTNTDCDENTYDFAVRGMGTDPEIDVRGNTISIADGSPSTSPSLANHTDFGNQSVCAGTISRTFKIFNTGTAVLTTSVPSLIGPQAADFSITTPPAAAVNPGDSTSFTVTFNPSASGLRQAYLGMSNNDCSEPLYDFWIQGTGVDPEMNVKGNNTSIVDGDATPSATDFTNFGVACSGTVVRTFVIENTGTQNLFVTAVAITGVNAGDFSVTATPASTVAATGSTFFQVTFTPAATGIRNATITVTNNDCDEAVYDFAISGTGTTAVTGSTVVTNVSCFGGNNGAINLTPSGGTGPYTFNWLPSGPATEDRTGLIAGTYSVQITDVNGCAGTVTVSLTQPTSPVSGTTVVTNVACFGGNNGAINLTPTGGTGPYTFNWLPSGPTTEDRTGLIAGTYSVQIMDVNGCTGTVTATVTQPTSPVSGTTVVTNVACFGGNTGAINLTPTGGTGPYTFNWLPSGPTTEDRTGLIAGTYSVQITDVNGCTGTVTATLTQPTSPVSGTTVVTNVSCFGGNNGTINLTPSGGTGPYTFNWLPSGPTTEDRIGLIAGTYSVQITDVNGCTGTVTATVTQPTSPVSGTTVVTNVACFGGNTGAINLTPSGGTGPYTFNWLPSGPTTEDRTGLIAGTYTVIITDTRGCTGTVTATVTQPTSPVNGTTVVTNVSCLGGSNGAINLTPTGGTGPYTFNWLPSGPTTEDRTGLTAGTYTVIITDVNGCTGTVTATVTQPTSPVSGTTVVTNVACFGGNTGAINLTPTGGTGPGTYTFNWLPSGPTTEDRTGLIAGTYSVQITDVNGCTGTVTATITQPPAISFTAAAQTNVSCFGGSNGAFSINAATGGTGSFTYDWAPGNPTGDGTRSVSGLTAGTWTVTATDQNGCSATMSFTITQPPAISFTASAQTNVSCFGGSNGAASVNAATGGTGLFTYNWTPGNPTGDGTTSVSGLTAGTWTVTATDQNGCTAINVFTVTQPPAISFTASAQTNVSCFGGSNGAASVNAATGGTGSFTYNWTPGNPTGDGTTSVTGLTAGTWTVTATDQNGCTAINVFTVTQPPAISFTASAQTNVSCFGGSNGAFSVNAAAGGTGAFTYNWSPGNPTGDGTTSVTGLTAGPWNVVATDQNGCTATINFTITEPPQISFTAAAQTNVSCFGGSNGAFQVNAALGGTGTFTYDWSPGTPAGDGTTAVTGLTAGPWSVTATDQNGCAATLSFTITQPPAISFTAAAQTNVSCFGGNNGEASVVATGGTGSFTYDWSPGNPTGDGTTSVSGLTAGTWTVTATDQNGCSATMSFTITEPTAITYASMQTDVSCNGGSNGTAMVMASGGTGTLTYAWSSGGNAATETGLVANTYTVVITDANACSVSASFTITEPPAITFTTSQSDASCNGGSNGTATVNATGGTGTLTYAWSSGGNAATETGLAAGSYTVIITDANGCAATATFSITEPTAITFTSSQIDVSCNGGSNGEASVVATGGTGTLTYAWSSGGNAATETALSAGGYTVVITDANACSTTATFVISEPTAITYTSSQLDVSCNGGSNGEATVVATGGTGTLTYAWSSGGNAATETGLAATSYTVVITDANGCSATATFQLTEPNAITYTASQIDISCNGGNNGEASVVASGGTGVLAYTWSSGGNAATETALTAGGYTVIITDENGCSATATFVLTEPAMLVATVDSTLNPSACTAANGAVYISVSGGTGAYLYTWSDGSTNEDLTGAAAGSYNVMVTDSNGCTASASANINDPGAPLVTLSLPMDTVCGSFPGTITLSGESPAGGIFSGTTVSGNTFDPFAAGNGVHYITYTFTDVNGCTASATDSLTVDQCSGIETVAATQQWNLFPNPTSGMLTIASAENVNGNVVIDVLGTDGKLIISETKSGNKNITLDISTQPVGVYFIRITGNETVSVYRVVKM